MSVTRFDRDWLARRLHVQLGLWVLLCCVPSMLLAGWLYAVVYAALTRAHHNTAQMVARHTLDTLDRTVFERYGDALTFSRLPPVQSLDTTQLPAITDLLVTTYAPYYRLAVVVDRQGRVLAANRVDHAGRPVSSTSLLGRRVTGEPWFEEARRAAQPVVVEDFHRDRLIEAVYQDQRPVMSFSAPIRNTAGEVVGVWSTRMAGEPLADILTLVTGAYSATSPLPVELMNRHGHELAINIHAPIASPILATATAAGYSTYPGLGWRLRVYRPPGGMEVSAVFAWVAALAGLTLAGGIAGLGWVVVRRVLGPLRVLTEQAQRLAQGKPALLQETVNRRDDIGELQRAFGTMAEEVQGQIRRLEGLNEVGRVLQKTVFSLPNMLQVLVETMARLTGARYAALGIFDETGERLTQFITTGLDEAARQAIGPLPTGKGLLGHLVKEEGALRLKDLAQHQACAGFPPHHPPMRSFLGTSVRAHGQVFGRLYLADKHGLGGEPVEFTEIDEQMVLALAAQVGVAIEIGESYRLTMASIPVAVVRLDKTDLTVRFANRTFFDVTGRNAENTTGRPFSSVFPVKGIDERLRRAYSDPTQRQVEIEWITPIGEQRAYALTMSAVHGVDVDELLVVIADRTEHKRSEEAIKRLAYYDSLTGLPNRVLFHDRMTMALLQARRAGQKLAVFVLDMDRFKLVNDTLGHAVGDQLLKQVAGRLMSCLREGDTVARMGGDEFTLILPGIAQAADAAGVAQRMLDALGPPIECAGHELRTSASIGISLYPSDGEDAETLLKHADLAMYRAKVQGGMCQVYAPAMNERTSKQLALELHLRRALEEEEFVVHYQPQVEVGTGRITGIEALVRWVRADGEIVPPSEFIPVTESTGLIVPLGEWVLRTACAQARRWREAGLPPLRVAVNLSARQFADATVVDMTARILRETALPPDCLDLELTEGLLIQGEGGALAKLQALRAMGVGLSIDDFGTGYSSLAYLKRFPISALKIDRSFISECPSDPDQMVIVSAIVSMAHSLNLRVVAEGVETDTQQAFLGMIGCDEAQGYLFSKPVPADALAAWIRQHTGACHEEIAASRRRRGEENRGGASREGLRAGKALSPSGYEGSHHPVTG